MFQTCQLYHQIDLIYLSLADKDHNYTIVKCEVNLKVETYSKSLVTCYYKARVSRDQDQQNFYKKILDASMTKTIMSALINEDGHINKKRFDGDRRTKTHTNAPEPVQELLNKFLSENIDYWLKTSIDI